jgi:hypothetical protein
VNSKCCSTRLSTIHHQVNHQAQLPSTCHLKHLHHQQQQLPNQRNFPPKKFQQCFSVIAQTYRTWLRKSVNSRASLMNIRKSIPSREDCTKYQIGPADTSPIGQDRTCPPYIPLNIRNTGQAYSGRCGSCVGDESVWNYRSARESGKELQGKGDGVCRLSKGVWD